MKSIRRSIAGVLLLPFLMTSVISPACASGMPWMPQPGTMVELTPAFLPASLWGMTIHPKDPFMFDFLVRRGEIDLQDAGKKEEYTRLIKYFLAALAVPDADQWVNLSPYEKDRIIPANLGLTEMGRDLLAQDYLLKQLASSLTTPDSALGKKFWDGVYEEAHKRFGTTDLPTDTFNKVWIMPDRAVVYEKNGTVYVLENHLKVMTEQDYLALKNNAAEAPAQANDIADISSQVMKEVIIPAIEKEVNEGRSFAPLRQLASGMLLATWYKKALKESILAKVYADQSKVQGVDQDPRTNQEIYDQYVAAFKKGVFNMIREDVDRTTQETIPRKYFSGGWKQEYDKVITREGQAAQAESKIKAFVPDSDAVSVKVVGSTGAGEGAPAVVLGRVFWQKLVLGSGTFLGQLADFVKAGRRVVTFLLATGTVVTVLSGQPAVAATPAEAELALRSVQTPIGLFPIDGTTNSYMINQGVIYDQAVSYLFLQAQGRIAESDSIFNFFYGKYQAAGTNFNGFWNMYNVQTGATGNELNRHAGPNLWVGLMALKQFRARDDVRGLTLAKAIFTWVQGLPHINGAVAMGDVNGWRTTVSTEHNIDYLAFLQALRPYLSVADKAKVDSEIAGVSNWIRIVGWDPAANLFNSGYASGAVDHTRASDLESWAIALLGPQKLTSWGINVTNMVQASVAAFTVTTNGVVLGVDAAGPGNGRAQAVFNENTEQMAVALQTLVGNGYTGYATNAAYYSALVGPDGGWAYAPVGIKVFANNPDWITVNGAFPSVKAWAGLAAINYSFEKELVNPSMHQPVELSIRPPANGQVQLVIGRFDARVTVVSVEVSDDGFKTWQKLMDVTLGGPVTVVTDINPPAQKRMYRLNYTPPSAAAAPVVTEAEAPAPKDAAATGGIDFTRSELGLQIKRDGSGVPLPIGQQALDSIHINGLVPVILSIQPAGMPVLDKA